MNQASVERDEPDPGPAASVVYLVKQLELSVRFRLEEAIADSGLTVVQYTVLSVLRRRPEMTGAELARRWHITPQSTNEVITGLERLGLIERSPHPSHRRRLTISLTRHGRELLEEYDGQVAAVDSQMLTVMTPTAQARFRQALVDARRALDEMDETPSPG